MNEQRVQARSDDTPTENEGELTRDERFQLLGSQRRRWVLRYLKHEGRTELGELAEQIAAWENGTTVERVAYEQRKRTYTALQQTHLPTLAEAGVIEFEADRGVVEATERARTLDLYLEVVADRDIPWSSYYLGIGVLSCVLVGLVAVGGDFFVMIPNLGLAALIGLTLTLSAAVHTYQSRLMRVDRADIPPEVDRDP
ncbi:hypothetical protein MUK72_06975 [Halococcus dombrowskii]|uniref:DUF7344 domain-containing protein n=1 Tax=Halococcus dombrowskii TaxID=179637 RepID=A0AAV3SJG6_HALDO|nr:hypothetical protein [Halococcus dombrowskii]UOO96440.1 hypothetical protein MUK72_06975 [Halococcus dombrowskii]